LAKNQELAVGVPPGIGMTPLQNRFSHDPIETQFDLDRLTEIARLITTIPCKLNPKLQKIIDSRYQNFMEQRIVDWSFAESLAFGSLLQEGVKVRLSGEDSKRGTFAQRHAAVYDIETDAEYIPLNSVVPGQSPFCVHSSPLSEYAVLGFEYGYSISRPDMLVIWEAQFGDFINTSQVIVDQFIIAGESKWLKPCRLVLLLPHGYEGQGPEHSSSYLERFLQLGAEENIQICAPTSPAQYFHLLRRQMKAPYIKPLVIMGPKSMLRNRLAISTVEELAESSFQEMVDDNFVLRENTTRLIFCTGKIYYDLHEYRLQHNIKDSAIIRIEQLYPFHEARLREILASYPAKTEMIWVQEEPRNRGAWFYISDLFNSIAGYGKLDYTGRKKSASPATGSLRLHKQEQQTIIEYAFKRS
jgi:2-oxoglutarate dehydrogenase E1 component